MRQDPTPLYHSTSPARRDGTWFRPCIQGKPWPFRPGRIHLKYHSNLTVYGLLLFSLLVGFGLRFAFLTKIPPGFNWDEASIGYNAYSLALTGKDEFGRPWPLILESFGDYKTALYSWLTIPFIRIWGLTPFAIRFPNVIAGILVIVLVFWLTQRLLKSPFLASIAALLTAISPWAIHASRFALEWHFGFAFALLTFALLWTNRLRSLRFPLAAASLAISLYFYHLFRGWVLVFLLLAYVAVNHQVLKKHLPSILASILLGLILLLPFYQVLQKYDWRSRADAVSIYTNSDLKDLLNEGMYRHVSSGFPLVRVFNNKAVFYGKEIFDRYLTHFSPEFLFLGKDASPRTEIKRVGKLPFISLPFLILGIATLVRKKKPTYRFLLLWLFIAPLPSALTYEAPHAQRSLLLLPALIIATTIGLNQTYEYLKSKTFWWRLLFVGTVSVGYLASLGYFMWRYYLFYSEDTAESWLAGHQEMVQMVNQHQERFDTVVITTSYGQPHIFLAFFTPLDPTWYQQQVNQPDRQGIFNEHIPQLGKFQFRPIYNEDLCSPNTLVVTQRGVIEGSLPRLAQTSFSHRFHKDPLMFELFDTNDAKIAEFCFTLKLTNDK